MGRTQCRTCRWRGWHHNLGEWHCNWADIKYPRTCIEMVHGEMIDKRGSDPDNCLLYERGKMCRVLKTGEGRVVVKEVDDPKGRRD